MELKDFILASAKDDQLLKELQSQEVSEEQKKEIEEAETLKEKIIAILKTVQDPEIPVNIWDLGLVYKISEDVDQICVDMTLTAPGCPVAGAMPVEVEKRIKKFIPEIKKIVVKLVWEPKWNKNMMSDEAKLILDMW